MVSNIQNFGDAPASPTGDAAPTLRRCEYCPLEMYHLLERCTSPTKDAASPAANAAPPAEDVASPAEDVMQNEKEKNLIFIRLFDF